MFIIKIIRCIKGYTKFKAEGGCAERFLNIAARHNIPVWQSRKIGNEFTGYTTKFAYRNLKELSANTGVTLSIENEYGIPYYTKKYKKRIGLAIGIAIFIIIVFLSSCIVWNINIKGNTDISQDEILYSLEQIGIKEGVFKKNISAKNAEVYLMLNFDKLAWAGVNIQGSTVNVVLKERTIAPEKISAQTPCNVVANKDAQIKHIELYSGRTIIEEGNSVSKGDIIVTGIISDKESHTYLKHARAKVIGIVEEDKNIDVPLKQELFVSTNEVINNKYLSIFGREIPFVNNKNIETKNYHRKFYQNLKIFNINTPIKIKTIQYVPLIKKEIVLSKDKAISIAENDLKKYEYKLSTKVDIINKKSNGKFENGVFKLFTTYTYEENIAVNKKILQNSSTNQQ